MFTLDSFKFYKQNSSWLHLKYYMGGGCYSKGKTSGKLEIPMALANGTSVLVLTPIQLFTSLFFKWWILLMRNIVKCKVGHITV